MGEEHYSTINASSPGDGVFMDVESLPLMSSPWTNAWILLVYLIFVLGLGPRMMENRPPFSLKTPLMIYNLSMVLLSTWIVLRAYALSNGYFNTGHCHPKSLPPDVYDGLTVVSWVYYFSKAIELLDTVFFVLRKKMNQVTLLHVYHHANMSIMSWFYVKYLPAPQFQMIVQYNSFVHILMYSYYFLASLGPNVHKYLWWKKYLTTIQIIQLAAIIGYYVILLLIPSCETPIPMTLFTIFNTLSFLILFLIFYSTAYKKTPKIRD